jgi:hypothetical protein
MNLSRGVKNYSLVNDVIGQSGTGTGFCAGTSVSPRQLSLQQRSNPLSFI